MNKFNNSTHFIALLSNKMSILSLLVLFAAQPVYSQLASYTFMTCGATGPNGPTQIQVNSTYASTLSSLVTINSATPGIQLFTVPSGMSNITISTYGAQGGTGSATGGLGARMSGEFVVTPGQILKILVGQRGLNGSNQGGGGGGSFVTDINNVPLCIAGGGGGSYYSSYNYSLTAMAGQTVTAGNPGIYANANSINGLGGTAGNGAPAGTNFVGSGQGGGGGGLLTNGQNGLAGANGFAFVNGGKGGVEPNANSSSGNGGFGGGGAGEWYSYTGGGGGGGYSGGGGGVYYGCGGGGGSFNNGTNQNNAAGVQAGDGLVVIKNNCNVNLLASSNPICFGQSAGLSTNAVSNISWSTGGTTSSITVSPSVTTQYTLTGQAATGCTTSIVMTVTVNPLPPLVAMIVPSVLCVGNTVTVTATGANSFTWTGSASSIPTFTIDPTVTTGYEFSGTNQFGCVNTATAIVDVNTNNLTVTSNTNICSGSAINLSAAGANTYTWNTGSFFASTPVSPSVTTSYNVSGTDEHNCVLTSAVSISVVPLPNVTANSNKNEICKGESVQLTGAGASTYSWSNGGNTPQINVTLPVDVVYSYTVTGTDNNGCKKSAVISVTALKCSGISEAESKLFIKIYPNPASQDIVIENNSGSEAAIEIMDLNGKIVLSTRSREEKVKIDISTLSNGIYNVRLKSNNSLDIIKVVKQ